MANYYEKVVLMLGENLASFLELSKKLLIDWKVEPKKLLHLLQNIRKDDLLGLIEGTHEVREIKIETKSVEKYADQVVVSTYTYVSKFQRKSEELQIQILADKFGLDPKPAFEYLKTISGKPSILPSGCHPQDGNYAIVSPFGFQEKIKGYKDPLSAELYCKSLLYSFDVISKDRDFKNYRDGQIDEKHLVQVQKTLDAYKILINTQGRSPIWIIPAQLGFLHKGESVNRVDELFLGNEYGLGSVPCSSIAITHPDKFVQWEELDMDCAGDRFSPDADGVFSKAPFLRFFVDRLKFGTRDVSFANAYYGSASAFVPQV